VNRNANNGKLGKCKTKTTLIKIEL
jgi:hypothetical protein